MKRQSEAQIHLDRMKILNDERVAMVRRREKPVLIHAISAAYLDEMVKYNHAKDAENAQ